MMRIILGLVGVLLIVVVGWVFIIQPSMEKTAAVELQKAKKLQAARASKAKAKLKQQKSAQGQQRPNISEGPFGIGANPDAYYEPGEVLVVNPPKSFNAAASVLGFTVLESQTLPGLNIGVVKLRVPSGTSVPRARRLLAARFPFASVDANHQYETQQGPTFKTHARAAIGWGGATPSCGRGIRLGQIDAAVELTHDALRGQRIQYRSYHRKGRTAGPADHGTAVAGILVGKPSWGCFVAGSGFICRQYV